MRFLENSRTGGKWYFFISTSVINVDILTHLNISTEKKKRILKYMISII